MKLIINGYQNRTFAQTMCLIFFPGEKFPEDEPKDSKSPVCILDCEKRDNAFFAKAVFEANGKRTGAEALEEYSNDIQEYRTEKRAVGNAIFKAGTDLLGSPPPWGMLTGVRPAKISEEYIRGGFTYSELSDALINDYHIAKSKAELLTKITKNEAEAFTLAEKDTCSLYISIPFCPSKCAYCSFVSYATNRLLSLIPSYLERLCADIKSVCEQIKREGKRIITVYVGGGTPSILTADQLVILLDAIRRNVDISSLLEFTVEAGRPDTITKEKMDVLVSNGVGRTSINPQTLNDSVLEGIGRGHTAEDFYKAYDIARGSGIKCINTDLIAGLPSDSLDSFKMTVDRIISLAPENVTVHTFTAKRAAEFVTEKKDNDLIYSYTGGAASLSVDYSQHKLDLAGYEPYYIYRQKNTIGNLENVGFSKPGYIGLYNIFMMEELHNIYAVGAGAVTKLIFDDGRKIERRFMPKYPYEYLQSKEN